MSDLSALVATGLGLLEAYVATGNAVNAATQTPAYSAAWDKWIAARTAWTDWRDANARALLEGCAAMERERDGLLTWRTDARKHIDELAAERNRMEADLDAALVDARRYEWIRLNLCYAIGMALKWPVYPHRDQKAAFDAAINAAMGAPSSSGDAPTPS